jgi:DNA-binding MarR family transcriptional regulator
MKTTMVANPQLPHGAMHEDSLTLVQHRIRSEFLEMPALKLTPAQAARLWALDRGIAEQILDSLTAAGFLFKHPEGSYLRASVIRT